MTRTEGQRQALVAVLDRLIPAVDDLPAAGAMGLLADIDRMAAAHEGFGRELARFEEALSAVPDFAGLTGDLQDVMLRGLETTAPYAFSAMLQLAYIAYYSHPDVHARIGWRTGPLQPLGFEVKPFDEARLETVRQRAPFWREA